MTAQFNSHDSRLFPAGLENASNDEKKKYFEKVVIGHKRLTSVVAEIKQYLDTGHEKSLIFLTGPSGVGKSIASLTTVRDINRAYFDAHADDLQSIPAVLVEAWGPEKGEFDWSDFYEEVLAELQIPLVDDTLPRVNRAVLGGEIETPLVESRGNVPFRALRKRFRKALEQRRPKLIAVDEGSNILTIGQAGSLKRQANTLKSIANKSKTRLLVTGAYDLFELSVQSGQLTRRGEVVHFEPYSYAELEDFLRALLTLQSHLPLAKQPDLSPFAAELFRQSLGCIGLLKTILYKCLVLALDAGTDITWKILQQSFYKPIQLAKLKQELVDGYRLVEGREFFKKGVIKVNDSSNGSKGNNQKQVGLRNPGRDALPGRPEDGV